MKKITYISSCQLGGSGWGYLRQADEDDAYRYGVKPGAMIRVCRQLASWGAPRWTIQTEEREVSEKRYDELMRASEE